MFETEKYSLQIMEMTTKVGTYKQLFMIKSIGAVLFTNQGARVQYSRFFTLYFVSLHSINKRGRN